MDIPFAAISSHCYVYNMGHKYNTFVMYIPNLLTYLLHKTYVTKFYIYQISAMKKKLCIYQHGQGYVHKNEYSLFGSPVPERNCFVRIPHHIILFARIGWLLCTKSKRGKKSTRMPQKGSRKWRQVDRIIVHVKMVHGGTWMEAGMCRVVGGPVVSAVLPTATRKWTSPYKKMNYQDRFGKA